jgi:hypothetical protein
VNPVPQRRDRPQDLRQAWGEARARTPTARCATPASASRAGQPGPDTAAESAKTRAKPGTTAKGKLIGTII